MLLMSIRSFLTKAQLASQPTLIQAFIHSNPRSILYIFLTSFGSSDVAELPWVMFFCTTALCTPQMQTWRVTRNADSVWSHSDVTPRISHDNDSNVDDKYKYTYIIMYDIYVHVKHSAYMCIYVYIYIYSPCKQLYPYVGCTCATLFGTPRYWLHFWHHLPLSPRSSSWRPSHGCVDDAWRPAAVEKTQTPQVGDDLLKKQRDILPKSCDLRHKG